MQIVYLINMPENFMIATYSCGIKSTEGKTTVRTMNTQVIVTVSREATRQFGVIRRWNYLDHTT